MPVFSTKLSQKQTKRAKKDGFSIFFLGYRSTKTAPNLEKRAHFAIKYSIYRVFWHKMSEKEPKKQDFGAKLSMHSRQELLEIELFMPKKTRNREISLDFERKMSNFGRKRPLFHLFLSKMEHF